MSAVCLSDGLKENLLGLKTNIALFFSSGQCDYLLRQYVLIVSENYVIIVYISYLIQ